MTLHRTAPGIALAVALAVTGSVTPTLTPTPTSALSPSASGAPEPVAPVPVLAPLTWEPTLRPVEETVTTGGGWTIVVDQGRSLATIDGPPAITVARKKRFRIGEVLLDTACAVIVKADTLEEKPAVATVIDLASGRSTILDGRSEVPTTAGGT